MTPQPGQSPSAIEAFRDLIDAYQRGDLTAAAGLTRRLRGVGWVVRPLPSARGDRTQTAKPKGPR